MQKITPHLWRLRMSMLTLSILTQQQLSRYSVMCFAPWCAAIAAALGVSVVSVTMGQSGPIEWEHHAFSNCFKSGTCMSPTGACAGSMPGSQCRYCEYQNPVSECEFYWTLTGCWQRNAASGDPQIGCGHLMLGICQNLASPFCGSAVSSGSLCDRPVCTDGNVSVP